MTDDRFGIVGKVIARTYKIRQVVAEGGFGVVYRAYHQGFRAEVALKCLKIPNELTDEQRKSFLEQFRSEAEVLFRLSAQNTNIVRPLHVDAFHTPSQKLVPFMALEWLEGRTLDGLIAERAKKGKTPLSVKRLALLLTPVAIALEQAHHFAGPDGTIQSVLHRDMKPENLFIARVGNMDVPKVLDFGISKVKGTAGQMAGRASVNADLLVSFSPAYGAPEQWAPRSYGQTGRWTDVWGLALSVVEAAKGAEVIVGDHAAMMGTILDPARRPTPRNEGIPVNDAVERVFEKALAVDPRKRYQSVGAFWDQLSAALGIQQEVGLVGIEHVRRGGSRATTGFDSVRPDEGVDVGLDLIPASPPLGAAQSGVGLGAAGPVGATALASGLVGSSRDFSGSRSVSSETAYGGGLSLQPSSGPDGRRRPSGNPHAPSGYSPSSYSPSGHAQSGYAQSGYARSGNPAPARGSLLRALSPALALMALSLAITLLDRAIAHSRGVPLSFGPVQGSWVAGALMVLALVMGGMTLKRAMDD